MGTIMMKPKQKLFITVNGVAGVFNAKTLSQLGTLPPVTSPPTPIPNFYSLAVYNLLKQALNTQFPVVLPPSPAVAGVYASVDAVRGVWKAPANIGVQDVIAPTLQISDDQQGRYEYRCHLRKICQCDPFIYR
jgi:hypothetical protein